MPKIRVDAELVDACRVLRCGLARRISRDARAGGNFNTAILNFPPGRTAPPSGGLPNEIRIYGRMVRVTAGPRLSSLSSWLHIYVVSVSNLSPFMRCTDPPTTVD
ncbi:hypothetical protein CBL_07247 [Carabus blaptoides fortunei]